MTPLVYIPGSGTVFWENSCASGTSAVGMYLAEKENTRIDLTVEEPGGILRVKSDPQSKKTWLHGRVQLVENLKMELCQNHEI
jgi:diaminopimelate epimerase